MIRRLVLLVTVIAGPLLLAACDTAEERAQKHYEKGMALLEDGDIERALVEFRNVFKLDGFHKEARLAYAGVEERRGNLSTAFGQYLRLVEQYPENLEGRRALARLAADLNNWDEAERHVAVAEKLAPNDPVVQSVRAASDYRNALRQGNTETADLAVRVSDTLLKEHPDLLTARRVVIDDLLRRQDWEAALAAIDAGLQSPEGAENRTFHILRLSVLERLGREDEIVTQLKDMAQRYPGEGLHRMLVQRYIARDRKDEAAEYLRGRVEQGIEGARLDLVAFLARHVSREAAMAEIDRILAQTDESPAQFRAIRAGLEFDAGKRDAAIVEMEDILETAGPSEETDRIKVALARMLSVTGNAVGARARIEEVLEHDPTHVEALKMKAEWLIADDRPGDALVELRTALDQAPKDAQTLTLMARAHERAGDSDLMGEMLALAVEASGSAPEESLLYAKFLMKQEKPLRAEDVLQAALRLRNDNLALLSALGNVYVRMEDWARAQHVIDTVQRLGTEPAANVANELTARKLAAQNREQDLEKFLSGMVEGESSLRAAAVIIQLRLSKGDIDGALEYIDELLQDNPGSPELRFIRASVQAAQGRQDEAIAGLNELLSEYPDAERVWLTLYRLHRSRGEDDLAGEILKKARRQLPESVNLKWVEAGDAERGGDIERAISIYEEMYAANSDSLVVANNLASLISSYRDDDESLQRAYSVARRLRGTEVPAFQDTYGWIAHRLGNHEEALDYLEPAARALPGDPTVQYHLAEIYAALGRDPEALAQFRRTAAMLETDTRALPFAERVKQQIATLSEAGN
ncbi:MAG: tetratricopeptide repeat protein [Rhodobacteraceae bacterium]|nr:tetratricopeptide repeat protein [Paracoccaceae bacterium]